MGKNIYFGEVPHHGKSLLIKYRSTLGRTLANEPTNEFAVRLRHAIHRESKVRRYRIRVLLVCAVRHHLFSRVSDQIRERGNCDELARQEKITPLLHAIGYARATAMASRNVSARPPFPVRLPSYSPPLFARWPKGTSPLPLL